ncbi:cell adhesion molecule CEACAM16-like isoform 2-T2 [Liasis olivaceus]
MLLMNSCIQLIGGHDVANTDIPITLTPLKPTKGQNIFLTPGLDSENFTRCSWYQGTAANSEELIFTYDRPVFYMVGDAYTGRETLGADCSLHIKYCVMDNSGMYTITMEGSVIATGQVNLDISDVPLPKTAPWKTKDIVGLFLGILFLVLGLIGIISLLYPRIRACCQHDKSSTPDMALPIPSSPPLADISPPEQVESDHTTDIYCICEDFAGLEMCDGGE